MRTFVSASNVYRTQPPREAFAAEGIDAISSQHATALRQTSTSPDESGTVQCSAASQQRMAPVFAWPTAISSEVGGDEAISFFRYQFSSLGGGCQYISHLRKLQLLVGRWPIAAVSHAAAALSCNALIYQGSSSIRLKAYSEYSAAIQTINCLLSNPTTATSDFTMAGIMLSIYFRWVPLPSGVRSHAGIITVAKQNRHILDDC